MKAIYFEKHGGPEEWTWGELPDPKRGEGEVLLRVSSAALNHLDIWVRRGWKGLQLSLPHVGGSDIVGEIVSGSPPPGRKKGEKVCVYPGVFPPTGKWVKRGEPSVSPEFQVIGEHTPGGLAEYVVVPEGNVLPLPDFGTEEELCALTLVGLTVWRSFRRVSLAPSDRVLVVGSGGGINSLSVQIAKAHGAAVFCLAGGEEKSEQAKKLGADFVINYEASPEWHREILAVTEGEGVDVVVDNVGAHTFSRSLRSLAFGGRLVTVGNTSGPELTIDNRLIFAKQLSIFGSTMGSLDDLREVQAFCRKHEIRPAIDTVAPLTEGVEHLLRLERGAHFGKIVLKP